MYNFSQFGYDNKEKIKIDFKDKEEKYEFEKKYRKFVEKYYGTTKEKNRLELEEISKIDEFIDKKIKIIDDKQENNFDEKIKFNCPKCGCSNLNKNGISRGRQRYICKNCHITFDKRSFSPLSNTKLSLEKWTKYLQLMLEKRSIRNCAETISVSVPTSFYMRHRILDILNYSAKDEILNGVVQVAFGFMNESFKGARIKPEILNKEKSSKLSKLERRFDKFDEKIKNINNKYKCRGNYLKGLEKFNKNYRVCDIDNINFDNIRNKKYLSEKYYYNFEKRNLRKYEHFLHNRFDPYSNMKHIKNSLICINTALDMDGNIVTGVVNGFSGITNGKIKRNNFESFFEGRLGKNIVLYTERINIFWGLKEKYNIKLKLAVRSCSNSMDNIVAALRFNDKFKIWNRRFKGVATKYLNNYLEWFKFLFKYKEVEALDKIKFLLKNMMDEKVFLSINMIKNRKY